MALRLPDLLTREVRHFMEQFQNRDRERGLRQWINESPRLALAVTLVSALLLAVVIVRAFNSAPVTAFQPGEKAWFYDMNTGRLFLAGYKQTGPIEAPSGPTSGGGPAGFRAHVYSYVPDPNDADFFPGFLERPDPVTTTGRPTLDMSDMEKWARGRLIKRVKDKQWVQVASDEGQAILRELMEPNKKGQTPIYQVPR